MLLRHRLKLCAYTLALSAGATLFTGCSTVHNDLTLASNDHQREFTQSFSKAYATLSENGDYDVVLVHDANADAAAHAGTGPLEPGQVTPRQVVHVRVFWNPMSGTKADHPAATNAAVQWYLFGDRPNESANVLEYAGSGLVVVNADKETATITIKGEFLKPVVRRGQMADPMGPSTLDGTITAEVNQRRVNEVLAEVKTVFNGGPTQATADAAATPQ